MKTLAIDTSGKSAGLAIVSDGRILYELFMNTGLNHSVVLLPEIDHALNVLNLDLKDFDLFVATTGPGSFTGLRIGLSTLKGFALSHNKPLVGVSTLEALAWNINSENRIICPLLNGPMDEIYTAIYRYHPLDGYERLLEEQITTIPKLVAHITEPVIFVGDGVVRWESYLRKQLLESALFAPQHLNICRPSIVAGIGIKKYQHNLTEDMLSLRPTYLRASEAEIKNPDHKQNTCADSLSWHDVG